MTEDSSSEDEITKVSQSLERVDANLWVLEELKDQPRKLTMLKEHLLRKEEVAKEEEYLMPEKYKNILKNLPTKQKDLGSFEIPCLIGKMHFRKALCNLGATINVIPKSVAQKIGLAEGKPTLARIKFTNRSLMKAEGVIKDVLVNVERFLFLADFLILDIPEDKEVPIILGRPILATARALIDVEMGELVLRSNKDFIIFQASQQKYPWTRKNIYVIDKENKESSDDEEPPPITFSVNSGVLLAGTKVIHGDPKPHIQKRKKWEEKMVKKRRDNNPESSLSKEETEPTHTSWKEQKLKGWSAISHAKKTNKKGEPSEMKKS